MTAAQGFTNMTGSLKAKLLRAQKPPLTWRLKNVLRRAYLWGLLVKFLARWFSKTTGAVTMFSELEAKARHLKPEDSQHYELLMEQGRSEEASEFAKKYGVWVNYGVLGRRVITNAGVTYMRDDFNGAAGAADITNFRWHTGGSSSTAEAVGDTTLGAQVGQWGFGSQATNGSNVYQTVATLSYAVNIGITEHGIFSGSSGGTLWDRTVFSVINVAPGDSVQYTYNLTISAGG